MAQVFDKGVVPFYARPKYKAANERELAGNIYPDLAAPDAQANARARRQAFDRDVRYLNDALRNGLPDEPPAQPRPRTTQEDLARRIYADHVREQQREAEVADWDAAREAFYELHMRAIGFERARR